MRKGFPVASRIQWSAPHPPPPPHLDVVDDERLAELEDLQHGSGGVVGDGVALQHVLGHHHLPGQPALVEGRVQRQEVRQVARLAAAETCNQTRGLID